MHPPAVQRDLDPLLAGSGIAKGTLRYTFSGQDTCASRVLRELRVEHRHAIDHRHEGQKRLRRPAQQLCEASGAFVQELLVGLETELAYGPVRVANRGGRFVVDVCHARLCVVPIRVRNAQKQTMLGGELRCASSSSLLASSKRPCFWQTSDRASASLTGTI